VKCTMGCVEHINRPTMLEDCFEYYKGCQDCQKFGNIQRVPASALNPIIKPWTFRGWGIDLMKDRYGEPERGGSEWEPIKILLEGDENSNKMNTSSNTRLRLTTQVGQAHVATGVPLDLGTNRQPSDPRTQRNTKPRDH
jgi:hypothetical protein